MGQTLRKMQHVCECGDDSEMCVHVGVSMQDASVCGRQRLALSVLLDCVQMYMNSELLVQLAQLAS